MTAIVSNGTGGGVASAGASWAGGVAPVEGDTCQIAAGDTITIDASWTVGADSATPAIDVLNGGTLDWDGLGAADVLTLKGDFYVRNGGTLTLDGTADVTKTLTVRLNYSAALANGKYGWINENGSIVSIQGFNKTRAWDTLSADAAALQKICVTTNDNSAVWYTGDTFVVGSMTKNGTTGAETDTIGSFAGTSITKAGANYSWKHDQNVAICNLTRNIIITSYNTSYNGYVLNQSQTEANFDIDWAAFTYLGSNTAGKYGLSWNDVLTKGTIDYCVMQNCYRGLYLYYCSSPATMTGNVIYAATNVSILWFSSVVATAQSCVFITRYISLNKHSGMNGCHVANTADGFEVDSSDYVGNVTGCRFYGNTTGLSLTSWPFAGILSGCYIDGNTTGLRSGQGQLCIDSTTLFGSQVANTTDINMGITGGILRFSGQASVALRTVTINASANYLAAVSFADTAGNAKTWRPSGSYEKSAAVPRTGTYSMLMSPTSATGQLIAESAVPAASGVQVVVTAYFRKNASYGSGNEPFLRLSGAGVVTSTSTMADVANTWQLLVVSGTPTENGFCKVEFVTQSAGAGAAVYVDDVKMVYTAIDTGSFDYWYQGDLPPVLMSTGLGATDVWEAATAGMTAAGSIGLLVTTDLDATISSRATPADVTGSQAAITALLPAALVGGRMDASVGAMANDVITAAAISAGAGDELADALLDRVNAIEAGLTPRQAMRLLAAALAGVLSGANTNTVTIRDAVANTKPRITATVDQYGNRSAVVTDVL